MVRDFGESSDTVGPVRSARSKQGEAFVSMSKLRIAAVVAALLLVVAACGNSGAPTSWGDNPADYRGEANVGQPERNFRDGCEEAGQEDLDEQVRENLADVCQCSFDRIRESLAFEEFKELDDDLRSDINTDLTQEVSQIMRQCILEESGLG